MVAKRGQGTIAETLAGWGCCCVVGQMLVVWVLAKILLRRVVSLEMSIPNYHTESFAPLQ